MTQAEVSCQVGGSSEAASDRLSICRKQEEQMDILIWINTLVILFALIGGGIVINSQVRDIAKALARVEEAAAHIEETAARGERLSLAILQRLSISDTSQA
jgi:hypothetical protein